MKSLNKASTMCSVSTVDIVTYQIKANINCTIATKTTNYVDKTILT